MEEPKPAENTAAQVTNPQPDKTETLPSQPPVQPQATAATNSKKRPLDNNAQIQDSSCYKMRLVLKDLRPHFVEVQFNAEPICKNVKFGYHFWRSCVISVWGLLDLMLDEAALFDVS